MIRLVNVNHWYNEGKKNSFKALENINIAINKGEFVAVVGQSGCGKTTLLNIASGLMRPSAGEVFYEGKNIYRLDHREIARHRNQNIGFVFQNYFLEPKFSAFENVCIPLLNGKLKKEKIAARANEALDLVGLGAKAENLITELSGGECQRVAIARAIVNNPKVIFADEPTGNLDSKNRREIMSLFQTLSARGKTIILVTHNESDAQKAKQIIRLHDGKIIAETNDAG